VLSLPGSSVLRGGKWQALGKRARWGNGSMHVEIQIKSGHLHWAKNFQNMKEINIEKPFNEYWTS